jgi:hypothetical protein
MQLSPRRLSPHEKYLSLWLGTGWLCFGLFIKITCELLGNDVHGVDSSILTAVLKMRRPWLSSVAVDLTALGSTTLVVLITAVGVCVLFSLKDGIAAWQLLINSVGAGMWTIITKNFIERSRPENIVPLVHVSGFSYPWTLARLRLALPDDGNPYGALSSDNEGSRSPVGPCHYCHFAGLCFAGVFWGCIIQATWPAVLG